MGLTAGYRSADRRIQQDRALSSPGHGSDGGGRSEISQDKCTCQLFLLLRERERER